MSLVLTRACAGCGVLRERCRERDDVFAMVADGRRGSAAGVAAVRIVQRADVLGLRVWGCDVGGIHGCRPLSHSSTAPFLP